MMIVAALILMVIPLYAQWQIPRYTLGAGKTWATRLLLSGLGIAVGYAIVEGGGHSMDDVIALFLIGFAIVHGPAAIVLFIKGLREEGQT
jgi:membrane-associated phospholipid phosphatase